MPTAAKYPKRRREVPDPRNGAGSVIGLVGVRWCRLRAGIAAAGRGRLPCMAALHSFRQACSRSRRAAIYGGRDFPKRLRKDPSTSLRFAQDDNGTESLRFSVIPSAARTLFRYFSTLSLRNVETQPLNSFMLLSTPSLMMAATASAAFFTAASMAFLSSPWNLPRTQSAMS